MKRKVIHLGENTNVITLPTEWVKRHGIEKGQELEVEEQGNFLKIAATNTFQAEAKELNITDMNTSLVWYHLIAAYRTGASEIKVRFEKETIPNMKTNKEEKIYPLLHEISSRFIGMELIQENPSFYIFKEISKSNNDEFETILRRMHFTLLGMSEDIKKVSEIREERIIQTLLEINEVQLNRLSHYCIKLLHQKGRATLKEGTNLHTIVNYLEMMGDVYARTAALIRRYNSKELSQTTKDMLKLSHTMLQQFHQAYYTPSKENIRDFHKTRFDLKANYEKPVQEEFFESGIRGNVEQLRDLMMEALCLRITMQL